MCEPETGRIGNKPKRCGVRHRQGRHRQLFAFGGAGGGRTAWLWANEQLSPWVHRVPFVMLLRQRTTHNQRDDM